MNYESSKFIRQDRDRYYKLKFLKIWNTKNQLERQSRSQGWGDDAISKCLLHAYGN